MNRTLHSPAGHARPARILAVAAAACWLGLAGTHAQLAQWNGPDSHTGTYDFSDDANWIPAAPSDTDLALFTGVGFDGIPAGAAFTVWLSENRIVDAIEWKDGQFEVTLDLSGRTLTALGDNPLIQGTGPGGVVLNVTGGGTFDTREVHIGVDADTVGTLNLYGTGTTISAAHGGSVTSVGASGTGMMHVSGGATFTTGRQIWVGANAGSDGTLTVSGNGTAITTTDHLRIGDSGAGALLIEDGATVTMTGGYLLAFALRGDESQTATGLITGEGSLLRAASTNVNRGISIGGNSRDSTMETAGSAHVTVADRARMESTQLVIVRGPGTLTVDNGTVVAEGGFEAYEGADIEMVLYDANRDALIQAGNVLFESDVELGLTLGASPSFAVGEFVELIHYDGGLTGTFANYAENDEFELGGFDFRFTYAGGFDNDTIGLEVIPEPGTLALFLAASGVLLAARRRGGRQGLGGRG